MSGEFLARLKEESPDVDWDAALAAARRRQEQAQRNPRNRLRHWIHARKHPELHGEMCSKCRVTREPARQAGD